MASPREQAAKDIAEGLGRVLRWSKYADDFEQKRFEEATVQLASGIAQALSILRGEQEGE